MRAKEISRRVAEAAEKIDEGKCLLQQLAEEMDENFSDRSEKWQEGEKGQAFEELKDEIFEKVDELDQFSGWEPDCNF